MTTVKITELSDIGANLASSTVVPVVNMAGTPITQKTNVGNIANIILEGAGVDYPEATVALLAQTVSNAAQPNITSVGTLTNVVVSGNATVNGNITSNGTAYVGNLSTTGLASITTLNVGTTANLGAVGNVKITGGTIGQILSTDGAGNLSWTSDTTTYGNSNVVTLLSAFGSNTITTTGNISGGNVLTSAQVIANGVIDSGTGLTTGGYLSVDGNTDLHNTTVTGNLSATGNITATNLGNISSINLDGNVSNLLTGNGTYVAIPVVPTVGNIASINLDGNSQTWLAGNGVFANIAVPSVGNIATLNLDGNVSNVLRGDGTFGADANSSYGDSNVTSLLGAFGSNTISTTGIITADGANLSNVPYANLTGAPSLGNISNINLDGNVSNLLTGNGTYVAIPTVPTVGNIATINLTGSNSNVLYGNGVFAAVAGGGANTGNVTFNNQIVLGTGSNDGSGGLYLAPGTDSIANSAVQYLRVRGGDAPTHIHLDTGNNQYYDQYFGDDAKYVKLELGDAGNVVIGTDDANGNSYNWSFGSNSNLTVPGNIQTITTGFPFTSTITGINTGSPTVIVTLTDSVFGAPETGQVTISGVVGTTEANNTWYFASIDSSNFVLYNDAELTSPVNGTTWTTYVSGGLAVAQGYNDISITGGNVEIVNNNGDTWTLDATGNLNLPGNLVIAGNANVFGTNSSLLQTTDNRPLIALSSGANGAVSSLWVEDIGNVGTSNIAAVYANPTSGSKIVRIAVGQNGGGGPNLWDFNANGTLTFPGTPRIDTSTNNFEVQAAEAINFEANTVVNIYTDTGNNAFQWQFGDDGNLTLPDTTSVLANVNITLEANDTGNITGLNLIGDSNANLYAHGNVKIVSDSSNTTATWTFGADGNLTIPGTSGGFIKTASNASIGIVAMDNGTNNPAQLLSINVGNSNATSIISAYATNATIQTNASGNINTWQFDNAGNLTLPTGGQIIVSGGLVSSGASPAPTINGFSITNSVGISGNGNIAGNNISATGNITSGNISTGVVTLTNGAVIKDTAGDSVSFGQNAGNASQGSQAVAIGLNAGANGQANGAVALGVSAGQLNQGITGIAIGDSAGSSNQGLGAVAIGAAAGFDSQGQYSVAMGYYAGYTSQANNSIILNATGANLNQTTANTFTVSPVRNDVANIAQVMFYNTTSKEVTYGNTISVAGNISGNNISATGNISGNTNGFTIGYLNIPQVAAANATLALTDAGKHYYSTTAGNFTLTVPTNANVAFATGTAVSIVVQAAGNILVNAVSGVTLYMAGNSTAANRVVGGYGMATLMKVGTDTWFINGTGVS